MTRSASTRSPSSATRRPPATGATPPPTWRRSPPTRVSCSPRIATRSGAQPAAMRSRSCTSALGIELAQLEAESDPAAAAGRLRDVISEAPLHEPAHRALMRVYAGAGRRQEALAQFQELKRGLRHEYEDEPDDETRRLYQGILTRSLDATPAPGDACPPAAGAADQLHRARPRARRGLRLCWASSRLLTLTGAGGCGQDAPRGGARRPADRLPRRRLVGGAGRARRAGADRAQRSRRRWTRASPPTGRRRSPSPPTSASATCCWCWTTAST